MTRKENAERQEAIQRLKEWGIKPGDTLYTVLRSVSRTGMSRVIDLKYIMQDGTVRHIGYTVAQALGMKHDREREGIKTGGCGMDAGFALVYTLGRVMFPEGFGEKCTDCDFRAESANEAARIVAHPANAHHFRGRNGDTSGWDTDGGYALKHQWL